MSKLGKEIINGLRDLINVSKSGVPLENHFRVTEVKISRKEKGPTTLPSKSLVERVVREYARTVSRHGVGSEQADSIRKKYAQDEEFLAYADALDRLRCRFHDNRS